MFEKIKNVILTLTFIVLSNPVISESYSQVSEIKAMTVGIAGARIKLNAMSAAENCSGTGWYWLDMSENKGNAMYSGLLAHKMANQKVFFQLTGCEGTMAKISHVYLCDTNWCE